MKLNKKQIELLYQISSLYCAMDLLIKRGAIEEALDLGLEYFLSKKRASI